jgi:HSP20 family protein
VIGPDRGTSSAAKIGQDSSCLAISLVVTNIYRAHHRSPDLWLTEASVNRLVEVVTMLMRTDPFRELDRFTQQVLGTQGTLARPSAMPIDAWRDGDTFFVELDLPGVSPDSIDLDVERNVVTVRAERAARADNVEMLAAERPRGVFSRQLVVGDTLDTERITADYDAGVLRLQIPVAEKSKPRKINIGGRGKDRQVIDAESNGNRQAVNA